MSLSELLALAEGEVASHDVASEILERVIHSVFRYMDDAEEQREVLEHVIESSLQSSLTLLTMGYVARQPGFTSQRAEENLSWEPIEAPPPCEADAWARASMEVRIRPPKVVLAGADKPGSGGGRRGDKSRAPRSRRQSNIAGAATAPPGKRSGRSRPSSAFSNGTGPTSLATGPAPRVPDGDSASEAGSPSPETRVRKKSVAPAASAADDLEARLRKELELRRQAEMAAQRAAQRQEEEKLHLKAMKKELRGRDYMYDFRGEIMLLSKVDPDKLPSAMLTPVVRTGGAAKPMPGRGETAVTTMKAVKDAPDRMANGQDYLPQESAGPTVHHDMIRLTGGVTLREGQATRTGPKLTSYGDKLTREAYLLRSGKLKELQKEESVEADEEADAVGPLPQGSGVGVPAELSTQTDEVTRQVLDMLKEESAAVVPPRSPGEAPTVVLPAWAHDATYVPPTPEAAAGATTQRRTAASTARASTKPSSPRSSLGRSRPGTRQKA